MKVKLVTALASVAVLLGLFASSGYAAAAEEAEEVSICLNASCTAGQLIEGATVVPARWIGDFLGYDVGWDEAARTVSLSNRYDDVGWLPKEIVLSPDSPWVSVDGHDVIWDKPRLIDDRVWVPLRPLAEALGYEVQWDEVARSVELQVVSRNPVSIRAIQDERILPELNLSIKVQYPQIGGLKNSEVERQINGELASFAQATAAEALQTMREMARETQPLEEEGRPSYVNEFFLNYEVTYNQGGWLSVLFSDYRYTGGAHGMTSRTPFTYNLQTGQRYELSDFFRESTPYTERMDQEVRQQLTKRVESGDLVLLAPFETVGENPRYYLSSNGLVIYFDLYEYTPYAAGFPEFVIPFAQLQEFVQSGLEGLPGEQVRVR